MVKLILHRWFLYALTGQIAPTYFPSYQLYHKHLHYLNHGANIRKKIEREG